MKKAIISLVLLALLITGFFWTQYRILQARAGHRIEEKILMLSDRPKVTKMLALGFDNAMADFMWIRAIQYFGGNFSSLDEPEKRDGLKNLLDNMVGLDPNFISAWKFGGFIINEAMNDPEAAVNFLLEGAQKNPESWKLPFDAGFISFYNLEDYNLAKQLFIEATFGSNIAYYFEPTINGNIVEGQPEQIVDTDPESNVKFQAEGAEVLLTSSQVEEVGFLTVEHRTGKQQSMTLNYADLESPETFVEVDSVTSSIVALYWPEEPLRTKTLKLDDFSTPDSSGTVAVSEVQIYGASNPETPSYVMRMALEMDTKAGRFLASWEQNYRYYVEAKRIGDEISASVALEKLYRTYSDKCFDLLDEAVSIYRERYDELPSENMFELVEKGVLQDVLQNRVQEDPSFQNQVIPVLMPNGHIMELLTTFDGRHRHLLMTYEDDEGATDWYLTSTYYLEKQQQAKIDKLQNYVNKYKELRGQLPESLDVLSKESWFAESPQIFEDPMGGEFVVDPETGQVKAINPKYTPLQG